MQNIRSMYLNMYSKKRTFIVGFTFSHNCAAFSLLTFYDTFYEASCFLQEKKRERVRARERTAPGGNQLDCVEPPPPPPPPFSGPVSEGGGGVGGLPVELRNWNSVLD
jgi:hypothetical protein